LTVILREVSKSLKNKAKVVFSLRLEEDDVEFLRTLPNASEFIRQAVETEKRNQRMLETKGIPFEIIHEIAEHFTKKKIEDLNDKELDNWNLQMHTDYLSHPLYRIAELTLTCPNAYFPGRDEPLIPVSTLDGLIEDLQSKEAKGFIQRIRDKIKTNPNPFNPASYDPFNPVSSVEPLDDDELETIRKIYDEAKMLLEQGYRKAFHKLPPADWHLTIYDALKDRRLCYKLP
jgi:hypothetical protein